MKLSTIQLSARAIATSLSTDATLVRYWLKKGYLKGEQQEQHTQWNITALDFADFLYRNPKWLTIYKAATIPHYQEPMRQAILKLLRQRVPIMDTHELATWFDADPTTIVNWIHAGIFDCYGKTTSGRMLVTADSVRRGLKRTPRINKQLRDCCKLYYSGQTIGIWNTTVDDLYTPQGGIKT